MYVGDRRQSARDRRGAPRTPLTAAVAAKQARHRAHLAQARNIGAQGMELTYATGEGAPRWLPRSAVALAFQLPGTDELIRVRGEVVFDRAEGAVRAAGVRFHRVKPADAEVIARFVGI